MKRDLYSAFAGVLALAPAVLTTTTIGLPVDVSQANGVAFVLTTGAVAGAGAFGVVVQESADGVTWADAPAERVKRPLVPAVLAENTVYRLGYYGKMRFARLVLNRAAGNTIAAGAVAVLRPLDLPVP